MTDVAVMEKRGQEEDARAALVAAVDRGDVDQLRAAARTLLRTTQAPTRASKFIRAQVERRPPAALQPYTIALLSSFSIELINDSLWAQGVTEGLDLRIQNPGFDLYRQAILDPSSALYQTPPDAVVIAVEGARWAPDLYEGYLNGGLRDGEKAVRAALAEIESLVQALRSRLSVPILFHSLLPPRFPGLGVLDGAKRNGQSHLIQHVNHGLADLAEKVAGFYPVDLESLVRDVGYREWHDPRLAFLARAAIARPALDDLARVYLRYLRALTGRSRKCVVLDLDNTLWGGVLGEEGPLGIALGSEYPGSAFVAFQEALLALRDRGVLLAIASKNNRGDVDEAFAQNKAMRLKPEHFASQQIHWEPKSESLKRIASELSLGLEHLVFVDDNPAECAEIANALPQVTTITLPSQPERYVEAVLAEGLFDTLSLSSEDLQRAELYRQRAQGEHLRESAGSLEDYYHSLDMTVYLAPVVDSTLARAAQMTQKTNQFNATTRRFSEADIAARTADDAWVTLTARVTDRFGDNGVVCLAMAQVRDGALDIETFLMSCRVIGRTVETAVLQRLAHIARAAGRTELRGQIIPTARNKPVRDLYERHGFTAGPATEEGGTSWRLDLTAGDIATPAWLRVVDEGQT